MTIRLYAFLFSFSANMQFTCGKAAAFILVVLMAIHLFAGAQATYRKPPFNGSIFGKRGANNIGKCKLGHCKTANILVFDWVSGTTTKYINLWVNAHYSFKGELNGPIVSSCRSHYTGVITYVFACCHCRLHQNHDHLK